MSIPGCNCARCLQGYPHRDPYETPAPIVDEAAFSAAMDRVDAFQRAQEPAPERYAAFNALLREIKTLHDSKGADYEDGGEEYSNLTAAEDWGIPAWKSAMLRTNEKLNRLKAHAKGSALQHEGARDSMIDIAVLSLIAVVLKERATR